MAPSPTSSVQPLWLLGSALTFQQRLMLWQALLLAGGLLVWSQRGRRPGRERLALAVPLVALNLLAPLLFSGDTELLTNISVFIATAAVTNFKLLSWAMDRGSLVRILTRPQLLAVYALPITPANAPAAASAPGSDDEHSGSTVRDPADSQASDPRRGKGRLAETRSVAYNLSHFVRKSVALAGVVVVLYRFDLPRIPALLVQGLSQYLSLSMAMDALAAAVGAATGLAVSPHFDNPYRSTSAADFWNRRWNLTVSNVLRSAVYDPVMEGRLVRRPGASLPFSRNRRLLAVLLVFLVSGLMHEAMFWCFAGRFTACFMWLRYFALWGVILVVENIGKKVLMRSGITVPTILARLLTLITVNTMVATMWWPPVEELGIPQKATLHAVEGWHAVQKMVRTALTPVVARER